jgi:hypothetical protein
MALNETHFTDMMPKAFAAFREKYLKIAKTQPNLYVQFTHNPEAMDRNPHPNPDHADPMGVYAYPINYVLNYPADIWYGTAAPYLRVLSSTARNVLILPQDIPDERAAVRALAYMGMTREEAENSYALARKVYRDRANTPSKIFMSAMQMDLIAGPTGVSKSWGKEKPEYRTRTALEQTQLLRRAGYDAVSDTARRSTQATINSREPEQIVFLHRGAFKVVEVIDLRSPQIKPHKLGPMTTVDPSAEVTERPFAQQIAEIMGDKLIGSRETSSLNGWHYYWTKQGRRIEIYFTDTREFKGLGEKPHRANKLADKHVVEVKVQTELGEMWGNYDSKAKFADIVLDLREDWNALVEEPKQTDWKPQTREGYHQEIKDKRMAHAKAQVDRENTELRQDIPEIMESVQWLADHYNVDFRVPEDEDIRFWFAKGLAEFARFKSRSHKDVDPEAVFRWMDESYFDAPKPEVAKPTWDAFVPIARAVLSDPALANSRFLYGVWWPTRAKEKILGE